ncbi:MAG: acetoacetate decarboxylase family protein, partial [Nocardioides sp.]|nr:acetoacetate decarboxylase family protein [Nocardioides sp.]
MTTAPPPPSPGPSPTVDVLGTPVSMPVRVRQARAATAMFLVDAPRAQRMIDASGLQVLSVLPRRTIVGLVLVRYIDNDLGPYDELGVAVLVRDHRRVAANPRPPGVRGALRELGSGGAGVLIHQLPVDGEFTCAAGRQIWGFPKVVGRFDTQLGPDRSSVSLELDGQHVVDLGVRRGLALPAPGAGVALTAYSHLDGVTRATTWEMDPEGVRTRPGG